MTIWGYYDDENDEVLEYIYSIEKEILPENLYSYPVTKVKVPKKDKDSELEILQNKIGHDKTILVYPTEENYILEYETDESKVSRREKKYYIQSHMNHVMDIIERDVRAKKLDDYYISGIAMYIARKWTSPPYLKIKLGEKDRGYPAPKKLPIFFPTRLRKIAYYASKMQLKDFLNNPDERDQWDHPKLRKEALEHQIHLFNYKKDINENHEIV